MFANEVRASRQMLNVLRGIMKDIDDSQMTQPIAGAKNPPAFMLCHLLVSNDAGLALLGRPGQCPPEWRAAFGPGADPAAVKIAYPSKAELMERLEQSLIALGGAATEASPDVLNRPHGIPLFAGSPLETVGHVISLLLASHGAFHMGQLSLMRRQLGFAPLF
jgi:hypothetical protein